MNKIKKKKNKLKKNLQFPVSFIRSVLRYKQKFAAAAIVVAYNLRKDDKSCQTNTLTHKYIHTNVCKQSKVNKLIKQKK